MDASTHVRLLDRERRHDGFFKLDRLTLQHALFEGGMSVAKQREILVGRTAICCLPYDPVRDEVILVEQFRIGPFAWGDPNPWMIEAPAGFIDPGEAAEDAVRREVSEETSSTVSNLRFALQFYPAQGPHSESIHLYVGRTDADGVGGVHGLASEGEDIRVFTLSLSDAVAMVDRGDIRTALGVLPVLWLSRHRDAIRRDWNVT